MANGIALPSQFAALAPKVREFFEQKAFGPHKDIAAAQWCANATQLTGTKWEYLKVPQKGFEALQPSRLKHLVALKPMMLFKE
jgi:hypothetical protein